MATDMAMTIDTGHSALMFISTALVQFMTPGLAFFYGGLVGATNVLGILMQSLAAMGLVWVLWYFVVYSLTFGEPWLGSFLGDPGTYCFFNNVEIYTPLVRDGVVVAPGFPGILHAIYQGMFAVITPALMCGAFVGRMRFWAYLTFVALWMFCVYAPIGYWNWGGGWMAQIGVFDFAGGMVVHESSGFSALATVVVLGRRESHRQDKHRVKIPHNLPYVVLGTTILWFGWFGFNGGSALSAGGLSSLAMVNTHMAASVGSVTWVFLDWFFRGHPTLVGACSGIVAGLVAVTPASGFVQLWGAFIIGVLASCVCRAAVQVTEHLEWDDGADVWGVHGMGGFVGTILTGALADGPECGDRLQAPEWCANPGTITNSARTFGVQLMGAVVAAVYAFTVTAVIIVLMRIVGFIIRVPVKPENPEKFDVQEHGELPYTVAPTKVASFEGSAAPQTAALTEHQSILGRLAALTQRFMA